MVSGELQLGLHDHFHAVLHLSTGLCTFFVDCREYLHMFAFLIKLGHELQRMEVMACLHFDEAGLVFALESFSRYEADMHKTC